MQTQLVREKALQNLAEVKKDIWTVLIANPFDPNSIITVEEFVGKKCPKALNACFESGFMQGILESCDENVVAKSMGFDSFKQLEQHFYPH